MFGHLTYLVFELVWALPVILVQWAIGFPVLRRGWRLLALGAGLPTLYFSAADAVAIHRHIWTLTPSRILDVYLGPLPIEEAIFFLATNLMVVQGLLLLGSTAQWRRAHRLVVSVRGGAREQDRAAVGAGLSGRKGAAPSRRSE